MTLLLGAITPHGIVMLSDGLCMGRSPSGGSVLLASDLQKVFPFEKRPIAIAHHGQNRFDEHAVSDMLAHFEARVQGILAIRDIAQFLCQPLDSLVRRTLAALYAEGNRDGCGFWVAGYGYDDETPSLTEVFWPSDGTDVQVHEPEHRLFEGGEGKRFCQRVHEKYPSLKFTARWAMTEDLGLWSDYLERLYKSSLKEPGAREVFGGTVRKLLITKAGNKWMTR